MELLQVLVSSMTELWRKNLRKGREELAAARIAVSI